MPDNIYKKKLIRITTVPMALRYLLPGQMNFMNQNGLDVLMISADGPELQEVITNEQCRHIIVPLTRKITPLEDLKCLWQLVKIFKKEKPDIVHTHTPKAGLLGMLAAKICGVKIRIHTVAGMPLMVEKGFKLQLLKFIEKLTYKAASNVWPNSLSLYNYIIENNFAPPQKLNVIARGSTNGINLGRFNKHILEPKILQQIKDTIGYSQQFIYLLCIGRLVADKGIVELVAVFLMLQKTQPQLKLILVGNFEDDLDPLPQSVLHQIKKDENIIHITWTQEVEYYMQLANFFVFPSHREGFPNVLLQAGAMQLPIICSTIPGNIDVVQHQQTGLLFPCGHQQQITTQLEFAIANPGAMKEMAVKLLLIIEKDFRRENVWQSVLQQYQLLV